MKKLLAFLLLSTVLMANVSFCQVSTLQHKQGDQIECLYKTTSDIMNYQTDTENSRKYKILYIWNCNSTFITYVVISHIIYQYC